VSCAAAAPWAVPQRSGAGEGFRSFVGFGGTGPPRARRPRTGSTRRGAPCEVSGKRYSRSPMMRVRASRRRCCERRPPERVESQWPFHFILDKRAHHRSERRRAAHARRVAGVEVAGGRAGRGGTRGWSRCACRAGTAAGRSLGTCARPRPPAATVRRRTGGRGGGAGCDGKGRALVTASPPSAAAATRPRARPRASAA
jgi:hypothetical protein